MNAHLPTPHGQLESFPVIDLLNFVHQHQHTGMLRFGEGLEGGVVFFCDGEIYRAEWRQSQGMEALAALLKLETGWFRLMLREVPRPHANLPPATRPWLARATELLKSKRQIRPSARRASVSLPPPAPAYSA